MRRETKTWLGRLVAALAVTVLLGYIPYHVYARSGLARTVALRGDLLALRARNRELRAGNERLAREAEALRSDLGAIERVARAELGWVRPGELVVDLGAGVAAPGVAP
ncbi:MAG TPA: septum formation initiator family protein [Polyangia bacterium]|jgi:cell division protein FtsB|nr:septum formation initiator family protein [Polyangia bacterium]